MNKTIDKLKELLGTKKPNKSQSIIINKVQVFELRNKLKVPADLIEYYKLLDNAKKELDKDLYDLYSFENFKSVNTELAYWGGLPNYRNIVNTLDHCENCFVFGDYSFHLIAYAIRLYPNETEFNEVYAICGDIYKEVANSFSDFMNLYLVNSIELKVV